MRRNVLEWICGTMNDATSAIVLTHNIDFLFLQSIVRPRLRKSGHPKLTIFADASCASGSYRQQRLLLDGLGRHYRVAQVDMGVGRRFHPKAILLAGPTKATALLLRKGLSDEIITEEDFSEVTKRLWIVLFFGSKDEPSVFQRHREACSPEGWEAFETAVSSPRLTAALTLWCFPDWGGDSTDAIRFKFSAMLLAGRLPWLVAGGTVEEIHGELRRLARAMPGSAAFETLVMAWTNWIQAGIALQEFERAVAAWSPKELAELIAVEKVSRGELLWQAGQFCVSDADYRREPKAKAVVHPLAKSAPLKILGSWLVPVSALLRDDDLLEMERAPRQVLKNILTEVEAMGITE